MECVNRSLASLLAADRQQQALKSPIFTMVIINEFLTDLEFSLPEKKPILSLGRSLELSQTKGMPKFNYRWLYHARIATFLNNMNLSSLWV